MLKSWEMDAQGNETLPGTERVHYTRKGVHRRMRKAFQQGKIVYGETGCGGLIVAVEQIPNSWEAYGI